MTEDKKHQLDELTASDILSYLAARVFDMEEHIRREKKRVVKANGINSETQVDMKKRIAELEKENAELKNIADFQTSSNMDRYFQLKRSKERLVKAKEIIRTLIESLEVSEGEEVRESEVVKEAEQFLEEAVK